MRAHGAIDMNRGGVRVYSHAVQTPARERVNLREERVDRGEPLVGDRGLSSGYEGPDRRRADQRYAGEDRRMAR